MTYTPEILPLSLLIDRLAQDGPRDEAFVRGFSAWLHQRAAFITVEVVEALNLEHVVLTFKMKRTVRMIATGYPRGLVGEVTVTVDESDFPFVNLLVSDKTQTTPYEICTLDYAPAGRPVSVTAGQHAGQQGVLVVAATVNGEEQNRVRLGSGEVVSLAGDALMFAD